MIHAMTVDLEDWYHSIDTIPCTEWYKYERRVEPSTYTILELFNKYNIKATFFILGDVAEKHPGLIKDVNAEGHEIATHGHLHRLLYRLTPEEFRIDLKKSVDAIENLTQTKVVGFRAPYWTITKDSYWVLDILLEEGFQYDSSIYPVRTPIYGIPGSPVYPYTVKENAGTKLIEFPPSTVKFAGVRIPVGGGFYMRALPLWIIKNGLKKINNSGHPALIYIHPPEFDANKPVIKMPLSQKILHYYKLGVMKSKLEEIFAEFRFTSMSEVIKNYINKEEQAHIGG